MFDHELIALAYADRGAFGNGIPPGTPIPTAKVIKSLIAGPAGTDAMVRGGLPVEQVAKVMAAVQRGPKPRRRAPEPKAAESDDQEDIRTAARLVERARNRFRWVYRQGGGAWHRWDGYRWARDDGRTIYELAAEVARSFLSDAAAVDGDRQKALINAARKAQQGQRIEAAVRLASTAFPDLKVPASAFDTDDKVINTLSGVVNLDTGEVRPARPDDMVSMLAPVEYDPGARSPRFERFLEEILPSPAVRAYVKRAAGYTITGSTREHAMFLPVGGGRNGKGVLMRLLLHALGDYGRTAAAGLLLERPGGEAHLTELASLDGARFVFASEVPPRARWNEPRLKQLVGGDPITARFMRMDEFTFQPRCKVWIAMNERPRVVGTSDAIWARLKEIRFPVQFRDADDPRPEVQCQPVKDPRLEEELLPGALPAVLAWAVAGAMEWQRNGLGEPPEVRDAVQEYRTAQDNVGPFLGEHQVMEKVRLRDLFKTWSAWCAEVQEKAGSQADLASALRAKGYEVKLGHGKVTYVYPLRLLILDQDRGSGGVGTPPISPCTHSARAQDAHTGNAPPALPHSPADRGEA
jgi:putative DNA primase/helicase